MTENTQSTFGYKWENFPVTENKRPALADPKGRIQRNGWKVDEFSSWINGKTVLDAGCGMGWWTAYQSNLNPKGKTVGADVAEAAVSKGHKMGNNPLVVGDIKNLPFPDGTFDYITCEEVIHHTPNPSQYLHNLVNKLSFGGTLTIYVYKKKPRLRENADIELRNDTTEMDIEECMRFCEKITKLGKELNEINETITVPDIPLLDIEGGTYSVHEFVYRYFLKCYFDWSTEDWDTSVATNFDWYHPEYAFRYTEQEAKELVNETGLEINHFTGLMSGYAIRGKK
jgi:SAM-dependent methyltransferase